jgi:phage shock protein A
MPELEVLEAKVPVRTPVLVREPETANARPAPAAAWFNGPVFSRARDIFAANMTELLDRAEDPARMIRMIILEMEETLVERQKVAEMAEGLHGEIAQIEQVLRGYEADIARLQGKLREARARQNAIAARFESAVTRARAREIMHGSRTEDAFSKFAILERRADLAEGRAEALGIGSLEDEILDLKAAEAVDRELEAMKAARLSRIQ